MATIEERVQALEQEHAELKKAIELQTVAIGALVSKTTLEKLIEQDDKLFDTLIAHDRLTNERLGHLQTQVIELDGKMTGLQVETRQGFTELDGKIVGLQSEMRQRFDAVNNRFEDLEQGMNSRFEDLEQGMNSRFEDLEQGMNSRFDQITLLLNALGSQPEQEK